MRSPVYQRLNPMRKIKLSILICTVPGRLDLLATLLRNIQFQIQTLPVEYVYLGDNKRRTIGQKRNELLSLAQGDWITFIDDDDHYHEGAIETIVEAINRNPTKQVIVYRGTQKTDGAHDLPFRFEHRFTKNHRRIEDAEFRAMVPNHLCTWKAELARKESFENISLSEDHQWADKMRAHYTEADQVILKRAIYHYEFDRSVSLCRS